MPSSLLVLPHARPAPVDVPVHDLIRMRWSPRAFSHDLLSEDELAALFEAARWAPSAFNEQPWHFVLAPRGSEQFDALIECLSANNQLWAPQAAMLVFALARIGFAGRPQANRNAQYDLGQAVAYFTLQATALGIAVHQMAGFEADKVRDLCAIPSGYDISAGMAIGRPGDPGTLPEMLRQREHGPRVRKPVQEFVFDRRWGRGPDW